MSDTILTDDHIETLFRQHDNEYAFAYAIEQAVLQSLEVQGWREAVDVLHRNGFVKCDIAACNCGSWHARYGLPERMQEVKDALAEAGHPLSNDNGNLVINALNQLIEEAQPWKRDAERYRWLRQMVFDDRIIIAPDRMLYGDELDAAIDAAMENQT